RDRLEAARRSAARREGRHLRRGVGHGDRRQAGRPQPGGRTLSVAMCASRSEAMQARRKWGVAVAAAPLLAGCGPTLPLRAQATPNPLIGATRFGFGEVTFAGLRVEEFSERDYVESKGPDARIALTRGKAELASAFARRVRQGAGATRIEFGGAGAPFTVG